MFEESIINISPDDMPRRWYNLPADLPWPVPEPRDHPVIAINISGDGYLDFPGYRDVLEEIIIL